MNRKKNIEKLNRELLQKDSNNKNESKTGENSIDSRLNQTNESVKDEETRKILESVDHYYRLKKFDSKKAWQNVFSKIQPEKTLTIQHKNLRKEALLKFYKYAAIVVIALFLGATGYYMGFIYQKSSEFVQISANNR